MSFTLRVHVGEKRSPAQYETISVAADITAENLEIRTPEEIQAKLREMQAIARSSVQAQLLDLMPEHGNGHPASPPRIEHNLNGSRNGNGNGNGNGRRSYGRPDPEPTPKQKQFLRSLARERNLDAETVGEICQRLIGVPLRSCTRDDLSKLIDALLEEAA